jgi:hypothetical protein
MASEAAERRTAIAAADTTCPRCGTARSAGDRYCLDCGLRLPIVAGAVPALRRGWLRRLGWYPGDWVWLSLLTLLVAAAGAAAAIVITNRHRSNAPLVLTAAPAVSVGEPAVPQSTAPATANKATLPSAPEPGAPAPKNGRLAWPANVNGWTIVLVSYPKASGRQTALATATRAAKANLRQVGIIDSAGYASLQPGYFVVFNGIYATKSDADAGVSTARQAGFGGAYSRQIVR